jgi:hypothetical protein
MGFGSFLFFDRWSLVVGPVGWLPNVPLLGTVCLWAAGVVRSCLGVVFRVDVDDLSSVCRALRVLVPPPALAAAVFWRVCSCVHGLLARLCPLWPGVSRVLFVVDCFLGCSGVLFRCCFLEGVEFVHVQSRCCFPSIDYSAVSLWAAGRPPPVSASGRCLPCCGWCRGHGLVMALWQVRHVAGVWSR